MYVRESSSNLLLNSQEDARYLLLSNKSLLSAAVGALSTGERYQAQYRVEASR